jgi:hypothetical protein
VYGRVYSDDSNTPAYQATVFVELAQEGGAVRHTQARVDENGYWIVNLANNPPAHEIKIYVKGSNGKEGRYPQIYLVEKPGPHFVGSLVLEEPRPDFSRLLPNYPNPFNPETWMPFQITKDANVKIQIYSVLGHLIRTIDLGFKPAGYYLRKDRASHWDGANEFGEKVASGIYFYTIEAGDFSSTRRMLVMK